MQHNEGQSTFTSKANDWVVKYVENFNSTEDAHKRELESKLKKSQKYIEWLISPVGPEKDRDACMSQKHWGKVPF